MKYTLKERIEELKMIRATMEEDAEKFFRLGYPYIANPILNNSKEIAQLIYQLISKGGEQ